MAKIFKSEIFIFIHLIILYFKKHNFVKCNCEKEIPIKKDGQCQLIYCTETEFNNNICSIDNDIIKTQWLNNFIIINEENSRYRFTGMVITDEGDLIIETSPEETNGKRLFSRLKKNGRPYYKNNNQEEILSRSLVVPDGDSGAMRYESQIFLVKINNDNFDENKQFLVSISLYLGFLEIYDLDSNNLTFNKISINDFGNYVIYSRKGSIIELNNKEYLYFFLGKNKNDHTHYVVLQKFSFYDNNINKDNLNEKWLTEEEKSIRVPYSRVVSAFKTESNEIIIFYISFGNKYKIELLNETYHTTYEKYLENPNNFNPDNSLFFKCIHLKESIGIFFYYNDTNSFHPKFLIENIINNNFTNMFDIFLNEYEYNTDPLLNDVIKINNKRFSFISPSQDRLVLYILLFDLYNNDQNIKIRFYKINIYNLYNYKIYKDLVAIIYNNCLTVSLSVCNSLQCDNKDTDSFFTNLIYFSYINGTDSNINIESYFSNQQNNNDNDDIYFNFPNNFEIDNNIFGYQIVPAIKIISIPNVINLYKIDNNIKTIINVGDEFNSNIKLVINPKKIKKDNIIYFIEYQYKYIDSDYDTFNNYPDKIIDYPENSTVDQKDEFNNERQTYFGKTLKLEFKLCNENCKSCKSIGKSSAQTKCEECNDNLKFYLDENTNSNSCFSSEISCPEDYPFMSIDNNLKCEKECSIENIINNKCILETYSEKSINQIYNMFNDLISDYNNEDIVFTTEDDTTFQLSNSLNEKKLLDGKKDKNYNLSIIDLGDCEPKLKKANKIPDDISLIIFKVENVYENTTIKNVQYEIYNPLTTEKITDMSPCENDKINIYVPTNLDNDRLSLYEELKKNGYDIFNPNDSFYNDICSQYTTINNTDLTLNDRKDLFYNETNVFCQENCEYKSIELDNYAKCECSTSSSESEITLEKQQFSGIEIITSFYEVFKFSNFLILKCFKLVFSSFGIKNNYGFIIVLVFLCLHFIFMIIFLFTGMNKIKDQMSAMIYIAVNKINTVSLFEQKNLQYNSLKNKIFPPGPKKRKSKILYKKKIKKDNISTKKSMKSTFTKKNPKYSKFSESMRKNTSSWGLNRKKSSFNFIKKNKTIRNSSSLVVFNKVKTQKNIKYSEFELDDLEYSEALKYDKRTFFQFFCCLVKREHVIVFTFIYCADLNLFIIKLSLFVFSVCLDFTTNVLFFNDESMHKIYLDYGEYNFISQIPQIIYSTVISEVFDVFFKYLSLSEKEIYEAKKYTNMTKAINHIKKLMRQIKLKFFLFYVISFLLMSFFWYFISAFCAVYKNTQKILFKDSLVSFVISLIYPFALYLIPASLRIISLRATKKDKRFLYKISNIFPLF